MAPHDRDPSSESTRSETWTMPTMDVHATRLSTLADQVLGEAGRWRASCGGHADLNSGAGSQPGRD